MSSSILAPGPGCWLLTLALADDVQRVWAIDISALMSGYLRVKAASADLGNVETVTASGVSLPLVDGSVDVVVSNYCLHHLRDRDKHRALVEIHRVLRPGGRLLIGDMMFRVGVLRRRDRRVIGAHIRAMLRKGPAGVARLARAAARLLARRWGYPASASWWQSALAEAGFLRGIGPSCSSTKAGSRAHGGHERPAGSIYVSVKSRRARDRMRRCRRADRAVTLALIAAVVLVTAILVPVLTIRGV